MRSSDAFIVEDSEVDPCNQVMITRTKNLSHRNLMSIEETHTYTRHGENDKWTQVTTEAAISSPFGWGLSSKIETFGYVKLGISTTQVYFGITVNLMHSHRVEREYHGCWHS